MRMHAPHIALLVTIITALGALLSSCSPADDTEPTSTTLTFWHFWSEPGQRAAVQERVRLFEQETGVTVELTELSWNDGKAKLLAAFNAGTAPDVLELGSDWVAQFSSAGVLMPLPTDSAAIARFVPYAIEPGKWSGRMYAYPWVVDTRVMYVNRGLLEKAGWNRPITTMDDVLNASELVRSTGTYGYGA
ncbi:MAG: ABC transporter substrate-binding protein, partial [Candidatus Kapaibacteriota bacterium]